MNKRVFCLLLLMVPGLAVSADKKELGAAIEAKYELTSRSMLTGQVKKPGTVLYVTQSGIQANKPSAIAKATVIEDGELELKGGGSFISGDSGKTLEVGDEMYLYNYQVKKNYVNFLLGTVKSYEMQVGNSRKMQPYQLALQLKYSGGIADIGVDRILDDLAGYFSTVKEVANSDTNTLRLGQSPEEVIEVMGPPNKRVELGSKMIFTYDDLKVVFEDGSVADVQ